MKNRTLLMLGLMTTLSSCNQKDLVVARSEDPCISGGCAGNPSTDDEFELLQEGESCSVFSDACDVGLVCGPLGCESGEGICQPTVGTCPSTFAPVCGCSGITYWNECLAYRDADAVRYEGSCLDDAVPCGEFPDFPCGLGLVCLLYDEEACFLEEPGRCWAPPLHTPRSFRGCSDGICRDHFEAQSSEVAQFYLDDTCEPL